MPVSCHAAPAFSLSACATHVASGVPPPGMLHAGYLRTLRTEASIRLGGAVGMRFNDLCVTLLDSLNEEAG